MPAVVYGHGLKSTPLVIDYRQFEKIYSTAGESSLVDLSIDQKEPVKILIQDVQRHPITSRFLHADFHQVKMTEKITTEIELEFFGESKAVKELGGVLVKSIDKVKIECLPQDLVHNINVDVSTLNSFEDMIRVADLKLPAGIEIKGKLEDVVVLVQPPRTEEELKELEQKPVEAKVEEVEEAEKKEEAGEVKQEEAATDSVEKK